MNIEALMTKQGMRDWTDEERQTFTNDAVQVRQIAQIIQARLAHTEIEGDRPGAAGRRARRVSRKLNRVARLLEKAAAETEAVNAVYVREVLELPDRRAKALEAREQRRDRRQERKALARSAAGTAITKSLTKTVHTLNGTEPVGNPQVSPAQPVPQYVNPQPFQFPGATAATAQPVPNISDIFREQEAM